MCEGLKWCFYEFIKKIVQNGHGISRYNDMRGLAVWYDMSNDINVVGSF